MPCYLIVVQSAVTVLLAVVSLLNFGFVSGYSVLLGGLVCIVPSGYLALRVFGGKDKRRGAKEELGVFYKAQISKFIITCFLFVLVFVSFKQLLPLAFFSGFILTQATYWVVPLILKTRM